MLENIDDGILNQPPADAGYHAAQDSKESCRTCVHYSGRYCDLWNARTKPKMVCGTWDDLSDIDIAMSEPMDHEDDAPDGLNDRQETLYGVLEQLAYTHGKFDQTAGADGSHYIEESPFEQMNCANCVFFRGGRKCEIVEGDIAPEALCKFWIIPENLLPEETESPEESDTTEAE